MNNMGQPLKSSAPGSVQEPGAGVIFRCETKQNASIVYSIRDWISSLLAHRFRNNLRNYRAASRRYRNRRIGEFLKELHLTEGRNTGFQKMIRAPRRLSTLIM